MEIIVNPNTRSLPLLDRQIQLLKAGGNLSEVFEPKEIELIRSIGTNEYLECLVDIKNSLADSGSEE